MGRENLSLREGRVFRPVPWSAPLTPLLPDSGSQPTEFLCCVVWGLWEAAEAWDLSAGGTVIRPCLTLALFGV